jgi:hypothetical protein
MSLLQNSNAILADGGYDITDSLRFRSSASANFTWTPSSAGNRKTWTWSAWFKRGELTTNYATIFDATGSGNVYEVFRFIDAKFGVTMDNTYGWYTNAVFRDPASWYHVVIAMDTTQGTASNRIKVWVNGVQQSITFWFGTYPSLNFEGNVNGGSQHAFGKYIYGNTYHWDGYITEVNFVDGQALTPSDFGEYGEETGAWQAKAYTGTYGSNGYYLDMSTSGSTITDQSGNGNNWTANNMNLTTSTATTYDIMSDVPTLTDEDTSNFCTLNAVLPNPNSGTFSEANLAWAGASHSGTRGTFGMTSGKWYWEVTNSSGSNNSIGISQDQEALGFLGGGAYGWGYYNSGLLYTSGSGSSYGASFTTNDVIGVAFDADAGSLVFYKNGVSQGTAVTGLTSAPYYPAISSYYGSLKLNFGQRPFAYTPPTGFKKLNTFNLPDSSITDGSQYFDINLYTGNGATQTFTNLEFSPDLVWTKNRSSSTYSHGAFDSVRGTSANLFFNLTNAENTTTTNAVTSFDSNGYQLGDNLHYNKSGDSYVGWSWRGSDSTAVSNTDGTITSTVSANPTSGFSVVTYTGNATAGATIGHGLGVAPNIVILKNRDSSAHPWVVYHSSNTSAPETDYLLLNTSAATVDSGLIWNDTAPTSSVFTVGSATTPNGNGNKMIGYCFADVEGFSKFGSYTGNGSTDGPFVYTGFRPAFVLLKCSSSTSNWTIFDTQRNTYNITNNRLQPNLSNAEDTPVEIDIVSNGFKLRDTDLNNSGQTFIYMAFAENPFKNSLAR